MAQAKKKTSTKTAKKTTRTTAKKSGRKNIRYEKYQRGQKSNMFFVISMSVLAANRMLKTWCSGAENIEEAVFWRERIEELEPHYFTSLSNLKFAEEWLWTYESLAEEYEEKGDYPKAIHCYRKFLNIFSNEWSPDEYSEYKNPQSYKKEISDKINNLEELQKR